MTTNKLVQLLSAACTLALTGAVNAQEADPAAAQVLIPVEQTAADEMEITSAPVTDEVMSETSAPSETEAAGELEEPVLEVNTDEMADRLNAQQQLKQTYTLERTIDGEVIQSEKRTVIFSRDTPYRETEAGRTTVERLKAAFDGELLTRIEAFEEAKLDFTVADVDRDGRMTADEFSTLVGSWRQNEARAAEAPTKEIARQRQYDAFLAEISPDAADTQSAAFAKQKFAFMAGAATTVSREDYMREYLLDFDSMDADRDTLLKDEELMRFRALIRGESFDM